MGEVGGDHGESCLGGDQGESGLGGDHGSLGGVAGDTDSLIGEATGKLAGGNGGLNCLGSLVGVKASPPAT